MKQLRDNKPVWHALLWIAIYVALVNVGGALAPDPASTPLVTGILLAGLAVVLVLYLRRSRLADLSGLRAPRANTMRAVYYLAPLFGISLLQYAKGFAPGLDAGEVLSAVLLVAGVGFIEELLFRGLLFQAILKRGALNRAILITGITFGMGHIVNLARGYTMSDQLIQVGAAVVIGIALAYVVAITGSIIPGAVFHALFNLSGTITAANTTMDVYILSAMVIVLVPYILFMRKRLVRTDDGAATVGDAGDTPDVLSA